MHGLRELLGRFNSVGLSLVLAPLGLLAVSAVSAEAQEVTFTRDVAPILQENCVHCHRAPGGVAPMGLETYEEVRPWGLVVRDRVNRRDKPGAMPPWYHERNIGIQQFKNDMSLSEEEIATINTWVDSGMPLGDMADMPPKRVFDDSDDWAIRPDLIVETEEFFVPGDAPDFWGDIEPIEIPLEEDRYVAAVQIREINDVGDGGGPGRETVGGRYVVHHLVYQSDVPGVEGTRTGWPVHEVGRNHDVFDADAGRLLRAGSVITSESLHLHANGRDTRARLQIGFQFHPEDYQPKYTGAGVTAGNTVNLDVLPNESDQEVHAYAVLDENVKIISFEPHLHAPGVRMCMEYIWGSIRETISCVGYDHSWVRAYYFADDYQPLLPKGSILHIIGYNDNTDANPNVVDPKNWMGGGNRSVANMFLELGEQVNLTDEQFLEEMRQRVKNRGLKKNDWVIGCPLCLATIPPTPPKPLDLMDEASARAETSPDSPVAQAADTGRGNDR